MASGLNFQLSRRTRIFHLKVWVLVAIFVGVFIVIILLVLPFCRSRKRSRKSDDALPVSKIPAVSKEIKEIRVDQNSADCYARPDMDFFTPQENFGEKDSDMLLSSMKDKNAENNRHSGPLTKLKKHGVAYDSGEKRGHGERYGSHPIAASSPSTSFPEFSHLGWGHWFTLRDLETATQRFSKENIIGEGGYGVVYRGQLINGSPVAVKKILNDL